LGFNPISLLVFRPFEVAGAAGFQAALTQCIYFSLNLVEVDSKRRICGRWGVQVDSNKRVHEKKNKGNKY